jgi:hypothetical protein
MEMAFKFPAFIVIDDILYTTRGLPAGIISKDNEEVGTTPLLFTNRLNAELFIRGEKEVGLSPLAIQRHDAKIIFGECRKAGVRYVAIDFCGENTAVVSIDDLLSAV